MTKILLVEDDKSLSEIYKVRLEAENYLVVSAGDGEEALAIAIKERPDLIISDVMMPKISGFDMLDILRSTTETRDIKVIMMTALSSDDQRARGEALGADRYLVKSQVGIEDVVRTVHDVLGDSLTQTAASPAFPPTPANAPAPATPAPAPEATVPQPAPETPTPAPVEQPAAPAPQPDLPPMVNSPVEVPPGSAPMPDPIDIATQQQLATPPAPTPEAAAPATASPFPAPSLPEPTAPFSTPRPASLGDTVINPLASADDLSTAPTDIASEINQALGSDAATTPPAPAPAPVPTPEATAPQPLDPQPPVTPTQNV